MKLLHIINSADPSGGGPIESIVQSHRELAARGHKVELVSMDAPDALWLRDFAFIAHGMGPAVTPYRYSARFIPWLKENAARFDCAILHGIWLFPSFAAWRVLTEMNVPYFIYTHGLLDPTFKTLFPFKHLKKALIWHLWEQHVVEDAKAVFFTCEEERRLAHEGYRSLSCTPEIVPYCVGEPPGDSEQQVAAFYEHFSECHNKRLILFLSRIHPKKGTDLALRAFAAIAEKFPDAHLVLAGPDSIGWKRELGSMAARLNIKNRITWAGMLSGDLKWGAFRAAEAFILPSHQENFGIAVVESLACGTPVLISRRINIWKEIIDDGAGFAGDDTAESATENLTRWMGLSESARFEMRQKSLACFAARFRSDHAAENLLKVLTNYGIEG